MSAVNNNVGNSGDGRALETPDEASLRLSGRINENADVVKAIVRYGGDKCKVAIGVDDQIVASIVQQLHATTCAHEAHDRAADGVENSRADDLNVGDVGVRGSRAVGDGAGLVGTGRLGENRYLVPAAGGNQGGHRKGTVGSDGKTIAAVVLQDDPRAGFGIVLQNNGGDSLSIRANGTFTMPTLVSAGSGYKITILAQPSGPNQTCTITNGAGTANANVTNVQIVCPAIFHTIGGTVVGLVGTGGGMQLLNNGGDNLVVNANGNFTFVSPIADNSFYDVSIFVDPTTQPQGCLVWGFQGTAIAAVTDVVVDCGHNDWTWMDGANTSNSKGSFTAQPNPPPNPPSQNNSTPGGRKFPATWTDLSGKLWFFGGYGYTYDPAVPLQPSYLGDMWVYIGTQNYGAGYFNYWQVVPPPNSVPPPRWGAVTWTDTVSGDLFLFGGQAGPSNFLNDLWKYNISGNSWTYLGGAVNQSGVYSAPGTIFPGSRWGANARLDPSGNVWLFGGDGYDSAGTLGLLNDLWKYNVATNQWSWISGSKTVNQTGNYGILGTAAASNVPGGRESSVAWLDGSGNFWLFGGFDFDSTGHQNALNDLWEFKSNQWTWMSGANVVNQAGVYGTLGVGAATNVPGARWSSAAWTDRNGNLWLFGGQGFDSTANGSLSDLWVYTGGQWIWVRGPSSVSQAGIYGIQANPVVWPHVVDDPGGRYEPGYWIDPFNQMWMFGGEGVDSTGTGGNGLLNDLWRYLPYPNYPSQN